MLEQNHVISFLLCVLSYCVLTRSDVEVLKTSRYSCTEKVIRQHDTIENMLKFENSWDTFTQDDIVKKQYSSLPYPEVTQDEILFAHSHYNGEFKHIPIRRPVAENLESLNHFLYGGKNNFK